MEAWIQAIIGGGSPWLALLVFWQWARRDYQELKGDVKEIKATIPVCQAERRKEEADLHGRITGVSGEVSYLKGRCNGHAQ